MTRHLIALLALLVATPAFAVSPTQVTDQAGTPLGTDANPLVTRGPSGGGATNVTDPNNAAFSTPTPFTVGGAPVPVGRSTAAVCTAGGTVTYTMPGGSFQWPVVIGGQIMPFAVTGATAGPACTYTNLN